MAGTKKNLFEQDLLGNLCSFTQGEQVPYSEAISEPRSGYIRYLYIRDFFTDNHASYVEDKYPNKIIQPHEIMMVNTGNTAGDTYRGKFGVLSNNAFKISILPQAREKLDYEFLWQFLSSSFKQRYLKSLFNHAGQPHVGHKNVSRLKIFTPPLPEQKKIAEILSCWDLAIERLEKLIEAKRRFKKGVMGEIFKQLKGQQSIKLGDCAKVLGGYAFRSKEFAKCGTPVIRISNVQDSGIQLADNTVYFNGDADERFKIFRGDILISMSGNVGRVARYDCETPALLNQRVGKVTNLVTSKVDQNYLYQILKADTFLNHAQNLSTSSAQANVSPSQLESFSFPGPSLNQQIRLGALLSSIDQELKLHLAILETFAAQKKALMQKLLTGKIRVNTSTLLEVGAPAPTTALEEPRNSAEKQKSRLSTYMGQEAHAPVEAPVGDPVGAKHG